MNKYSELNDNNKLQIKMRNKLKNTHDIMAVAG